MQALVAQTKTAKQAAKQTEMDLAASAEQLANKAQEIAALRVSLPLFMPQHLTLPLVFIPHNC